MGSPSTHKEIRSSFSLGGYWTWQAMAGNVWDGAMVMNQNSPVNGQLTAFFKRTKV